MNVLLEYLSCDCKICPAIFVLYILGEKAPSEMSFKPQFIRVAPPLYRCEDEVLLPVLSV
jgi:hypothetical protein